MLGLGAARLKEALETAGFGGEALDELCRATAEARAEHPALAVDDIVFAERLASVLGGDGQTRIDELRVPDLYLSCALAARDPSALEWFEEHLVPQIDRGLRSFTLSSDERDELRQRIRIRVLLSSADTPARISTYSGRGSLAGWIRTVASRLASNHRRDDRPHAELDRIPELALTDTPEFSCLREQDRVVFRECLRGAFGSLDSRQRAIIRLHYGNGMAAVALARSYNVHESTMSRWLAAARVAMAECFKTLAVEAVGEQGSATNLLELIRSRLDLSLQSLFATTTPKK